MDRLFTKAKELGIYWAAMSGGEPFVYPCLFELAGKHNDMAFMVYTNGTLIDEEAAGKIVEVGNLSPTISLEGRRERTDVRRGAGTFDKVIGAMDLFKERGVIFGVSITITRDNVMEVTIDDFIDFLVDKGVTYGWFFHYIPIGRNPDPELMVTPEQRAYLAVAGDLVDTVVMVPPRASPANYAPSPRELEQLSKADLYFSIGIPAEEANILPKLPTINQHIKVVDLAAEVSKVCPLLYYSPGNPDPHIWLSPKRAKVIVNVIARELSSIDPENKDIYQANARIYGEKLDQLDQKIKAALQGLPNRTFIVFHPAFGYFAADYGLEMISIEKEGKKATAENLQQIIDLARAQNIRVIFYQASITSKQAETIAEEIGGYAEQVDPLAPDYIENLEKIAAALAAALK
ncbi:metal ABC transporter solute-binding protein, Zn/Mn family [Candidatus Methanoliparum sp. LAM-1]|nr:zinc ABC transporter substrate-binding protein [Candidatus Methanoliparum sp. LAM-1]